MLPYRPIPQEDIDHFDQQGYLIVRNALDSETIERLIAVGDRLLEGDLQTNRQTNNLSLIHI